MSDDTLYFTIWEKKVPVSRRDVELYQREMSQGFDDVTARYLAKSFGCTCDMSVEEIARGVSENIAEHVKVQQNLQKKMEDGTLAEFFR